MKHYIKMIEYTERFDMWAEQDNVALFDERDITEEKINKLIREGDEYHPYVVFMTKKQYENVFRSLKGSWYYTIIINDEGNEIRWKIPCYNS